MLTEQIIKKESKQHDCKVIQRLKLERKGLREISNIDLLGGLLELSLAWNEITLIQGLESLITLKRLDLSHNKISKIENLSRLECLTHIDLSANLISGLDCFGGFIGLSELRSLKLQGSQGEDANPVCASAGYHETVYRVLPELIDLDGGSIEVLQALHRVRGDPENDPKDPKGDSGVPLASIENWFTPGMLEVEDYVIEVSGGSGNGSGGSSGSGSGGGGKDSSKDMKGKGKDGKYMKRKQSKEVTEKEVNDIHPVYRDEEIERITSIITQKLSGDCLDLLMASDAAVAKGSAV